MTEKAITSADLPMVFQAKYLGACKAAGLWGIKHTRKPVDILVDTAKNNRHNLPIVDIIVSAEGLQIVDIAQKSLPPANYDIGSISYGVQDLHFTRVFCMIICSNKTLETKSAVASHSNPKEENLFMCHAFACESKHQARQLTFALAAAFAHFADVMKSRQEKDKVCRTIDLRTPDQIEDEESETEA